MLPEKETSSGHSQPHDSQSGQARTEGHIHNPYGTDVPSELQSLSPLDSVLRLLDCVNENFDDYSSKRAQIRLVMDYIQSFIDDRPYTPPTEADLDDFPF